MVKISTFTMFTTLCALGFAMPMNEQHLKSVKTSPSHDKASTSSYHELVPPSEHDFSDSSEVHTSDEETIRSPIWQPSKGTRYKFLGHSGPRSGGIKINKKKVKVNVTPSKTPYGYYLKKDLKGTKGVRMPDYDHHPSYSGMTRHELIERHGQGYGEQEFMSQMADHLEDLPRHRLKANPRALSDLAHKDHKLHRFLDWMGPQYRDPHLDPDYHGMTERRAINMYGAENGGYALRVQEGQYRRTYRRQRRNSSSP